HNTPTGWSVGHAQIAALATCAQDPKLRDESRNRFGNLRCAPRRSLLGSEILQVGSSELVGFHLANGNQLRVASSPGDCQCRPRAVGAPSEDRHPPRSFEGVEFRVQERLAQLPLVIAMLKGDRLQLCAATEALPSRLGETGASWLYKHDNGSRT